MPSDQFWLLQGKNSVNIEGYADIVAHFTESYYVPDNETTLDNEIGLLFKDGEVYTVPERLTAQEMKTIM